MKVLKEGVLKQGSDLYLLYTFLKRLTTPFEETKAFEFGIIDENGKVLKKRRTLKTEEEKDAYTMMDTMIFNIKKIMAKIPFGKSKLFSYAASLFLLKEQKSKYKYLIDEEVLEKDLLAFFDSLDEEDLEEQKKKSDIVIKKSKKKSDVAVDDKTKEKEVEADKATAGVDSLVKGLAPSTGEEPPEGEEGEDQY